MKSITVEVPLPLCRMLLSKREDLKDPEQFDDFRAVAIGMLQILVDQATPETPEPVRRTRRRRGMPQQDESATLKDPAGN